MVFLCEVMFYVYAGKTALQNYCAFTTHVFKNYFLCPAKIESLVTFDADEQK